MPEILHALNAYVVLELSLLTAALAALQRPVREVLAERERVEPQRRASVDAVVQRVERTDPETNNNENSNPSKLCSRRFSTSIIPTRTPFFTRGRRPSISVRSNTFFLFILCERVPLKPCTASNWRNFTEFSQQNVSESMDIDPQPEASTQISNDNDKSTIVDGDSSTEAASTQISNDNDKSTTVDGESNFTSNALTSIATEGSTKTALHEYRDVNIYDQTESLSDCDSTILESSSDTDFDYEKPLEENISNQTEETMNRMLSKMENVGLDSHENKHEISLIAMSLKRIPGRRPSTEANNMPTIHEDSEQKQQHESEKENQPPNKRQKLIIID